MVTSESIEARLRERKTAAATQLIELIRQGSSDVDRLIDLAREAEISEDILTQLSSAMGAAREAERLESEAADIERHNAEVKQRLNEVTGIIARIEAEHRAKLNAAKEPHYKTLQAIEGEMRRMDHGLLRLAREKRELARESFAWLFDPAVPSPLTPAGVEHWKAELSAARADIARFSRDRALDPNESKRFQAERREKVAGKMLEQAGVNWRSSLSR